MEFDVRYRDYIFKHAFTPSPDLSAERYKAHYHNTYEFLYVLHGSADFLVKHTLYNIRPGSLLIVQPGEYHNILFKTADPYERYVIRFNPHSIYPYIRKHLEKAESVYYIEGSPISAEFFRMDEHLTAAMDEGVRLNACIGSLHIIISHLISSQNLIQRADYVNADGQKIVEYIDRHLPDIHSADDIADALHMSKSSIYKIFAKQFDTSLMSYIRTQKCMMARNLLREGIAPTEASNMIGFSHYSSFYRNYLKIFHEPPGGGPRRE